MSKMITRRGIVKYTLEKAAVILANPIAEDKWMGIHLIRNLENDIVKELDEKYHE